MRSSLLKPLFVLLALGFAVSPAIAGDDAPMSIEGTRTVNAEEIIALAGSKPDLVIIDNRKESDYAAGHIEGAKRLLNTDMTSEDSLAKLVPSKTTPTLFYCNGLKCGRAADAAAKAVAWGYKEVYYYALGMTEWNEKNLPFVVGAN